MSRRRAAALALVASVLSVLSVLSVSPVGAQDEGPQRSWLGLGDSYSSGEGIPGTTPDDSDSPNGGANSQGRDCRRATGEGTDATAWAVGAYDEVAGELGLGHLDFVACTGAITDEAASQISEAGTTTGRDRWDVVSFSFGGNNIGFADVLEGCLDLSASWDLFDLTPGCDITEQQLRSRVDMLTGGAGISDGYEGRLTLPGLFELIAANQVAPGGDVIVVGYPHLVEETGRWDRWRRNLIGNCEGIHDYDVATLRSVTGYLNEQIAHAVDAADQAHRGEGVRFHFLDISRDPYEYSDNPRDRHGLCSRDPWLNGITPGITSGDFWEQSRRSFHPKQDGHTNTARVLAAYTRANIAFDDAPQRFDASSVDLVNATMPSGTCGNETLGWPHDPIPLVNGEGESVNSAGDFGGAAITGASVIGYADFDADGTTDALMSVDCFGSPIDMCCAGRASLLTFALPVTIGDGGSVELIGAPITGGDSNGAQRQISEISLDGTTVVTTEGIIYPEQYTEAQVGYPPGQILTVTYQFDGSQWVAG